MAQVIDTLVNFLFVFIASFIFFKVIEMLIGNRVSAEVELGGLDVPEMGLSGYPEFTLSHFSPPSDSVGDGGMGGRSALTTKDSRAAKV